MAKAFAGQSLHSVDTTSPACPSLPLSSCSPTTVPWPTGSVHEETASEVTEQERFNANEEGEDGKDSEREIQRNCAKHEPFRRDFLVVIGVRTCPPMQGRGFILVRGTSSHCTDLTRSKHRNYRAGEPQLEGHLAQ